MAQWQHPMMTAVHPWLVGAAWTLAAVTLVTAVWGLISDEGDALLRPMFATAVGSAVIGLIARVANPFIDADDRFHAWCALSMLVLGLCMLWEYLADWDFKPFRFLVWVPPAIVLIRAAMTIPAHVKSGSAELVVLLNQVPDTAKNALIIATVLLGFLAACVKLVKSFTT